MRIENSISSVVHALALALQEAFENGWESVIFEYSDGVLSSFSAYIAVLYYLYRLLLHPRRSK